MTRQNVNVSLTPSQAAFLAQCVDSGRYESVSQAIHEAVRLLEQEHARGEAEVVRVRSLIAEGAFDLDRGATVDAATFLHEWRQQIAAREVRGAKSARDAG